MSDTPPKRPLLLAMAQAGYEFMVKADAPNVPALHDPLLPWENQSDQLRADWEGCAMAMLDVSHAETYWTAYAVEKADGSLVQIADRMPKTWAEPGLATSTRLTLAKQAGLLPEEFGSVVEVVLIRTGFLVPSEEKRPGTGEKPTQPPADRPRWLAVLQHPNRADDHLYRLEYDESPREYEKGRPERARLIERVELPPGFSGGLLDAVQWWKARKQPEAQPKEPSNADG